MLLLYLIGINKEYTSSLIINQKYFTTAVTIHDNNFNKLFKFCYFPNTFLSHILFAIQFVLEHNNIASLRVLRGNLKIKPFSPVYYYLLDFHTMQLCCLQNDFNKLLLFINLENINRYPIFFQLLFDR